jgi:hypothetical protein
MSLVFQNIDPHSLTARRVCPPLPQAGVHTCRAEGGRGVNILEDERDRIALLQ